MNRFTTSIKVDEEKWRKFKAHCALKGVDISKLLEKLIDKELKRK